MFSLENDKSLLENKEWNGNGIDCLAGMFPSSNFEPVVLIRAVNDTVI